MTYSESAKGITITLNRALKEVDSHGACAEAFLKDLGEHAAYKASDVLRWLGY